MSPNQFDNPTPQFGTAEYIGSPGEGHCHYCNQPVAGNFYRINGAVACPACAQKMRANGMDDSHAAYVRGVLFGVGAAILGMVLYATFAIATGIVIGYASLAVGWLVGTAIIKGSNGVGGRRYQILAGLLTYAAVSIAAVPVQIHYSNEHKSRQTQRQHSEQSDDGDPSEQPQNSTAKPKLNIFSALGALALLGLASPFLELFENPFGGLIGLVILFVGIRIAVRLTAAKLQEIYGPFASSPQIQR
jgi:hypothetical protein